MPSDDAGSIIVVLVCVVSAALASGLTQGLLSLDHMEMQIKSRSGTDDEKFQASRVLPIIERHHLLLVSLMLWNASAMEILPLFLDRLVPEWLAIILSVSLILVVGEIIPAAILTVIFVFYFLSYTLTFLGPNQLIIASTLIPLVYVVMGIFLPVAYPISVVLDFFLGTDEGITTFNRVELSTMVRIQREEREKRGEHAVEEGVNMEEVTMIDGVLRFRDKLVKDVMTKQIFMLSIDESLNMSTLSMIFKSGYSRIPIYEKDRNDILGIILTKDMLFIDPKEEILVRSFFAKFARPLQAFFEDQKLHEVLRVFRATRGHMALVRDVNNEGPGDPIYEVRGIVTLEDVVEEILGEEILDETDAHFDEDGRYKHDRHRDIFVIQNELREHDATIKSKSSKSHSLRLLDEVKISIAEES